LVLAAFSVPALLSLVGPTLPRADAVSVDLRVAAFTFGLALVTGIVFGLVPALQCTRLDVREALNEAGRSAIGGGPWQRRARTALVIVEIAPPPTSGVHRSRTSRPRAARRPRARARRRSPARRSATGRSSGSAGPRRW